MSYIDQSKNRDDIVRPGEQWFFYWKTSPALWEGKIQSFTQSKKIFIPLNWGYHFNGVSWDFYGDNPENDLSRLLDLIWRNNLEPILMIPVSPAPFMINGGVPHVAAKSQSKDIHGLYLVTLDHEKKLHKMYSFFEPSVFKAYSDFLAHLKIFIESKKRRIHLKSMDCHYLSQGEVLSYFSDTSLAFDQGFSRYLKKSFGEKIDLTSVDEEKRLRALFLSEVKELFRSLIGSVFQLSREDFLEILFLGGASLESLERSLESGKSDQDYLKDFFECYYSQRLVSTCLLAENEKTEMVKSVLKEHYSGHVLETFYSNSEGGCLDQDFRDLEIFHLFSKEKNISRFPQELIELLDLNYSHLYKFYSQIPSSVEWYEAHHESVKIIPGSWVSGDNFSQTMKLFLMGQVVLIDLQGLDPDLEKKLYLFVVENNLKSQHVKFHTLVTIYELGEGKLILFNSSLIATSEAKFSFWNQLISFLKIKNLHVKKEEDLHTFWRVRESQPHELNFIDIRRVYFYNPTSYKKTVFIQGQKHFAYMKMIDPNKAKAISSPKGVDVELLPKGMISLDFGHFEEVL